MENIPRAVCVCCLYGKCRVNRKACSVIKCAAVFTLCYNNNVGIIFFVKPFSGVFRLFFTRNTESEFLGRNKYIGIRQQAFHIIVKPARVVKHLCAVFTCDFYSLQRARHFVAVYHKQVGADYSFFLLVIKLQGRQIALIKHAGAA